MTPALRVADISTYLSSTGWRRTPETWRDASIWSRGETEVLVPANDDMGDALLRVHDLLTSLADVEDRDAREIAREIAEPLVDTTTYRPDRVGSTSLPSAFRAIDGFRRMLGIAARTVIDGPDRSPSQSLAAQVAELLAAIRLRITPDSEFALTVTVPMSTVGRHIRSPDLGRSVMTQVYDASSAIDETVVNDDPGTLDGAVAVGVTAPFCVALSDLAGHGRQDPFQLGFRWAHGAPSPLPTETLIFPPGAGRQIARAARRLRDVDLSGPASVEGVVEGLHDNELGNSRWRVRIRGELRTDRTAGSRRGVWVRLDGPTSYRLAVDAHRDRRRVRATGFRGGVGSRQDLSIPPGGLEVLDFPNQGSAI